MRIGVRKEGNVNILELNGPMIIGEPELQLRECFIRLLDAGERQFVFDLTSVTQLDSAGIGETLACNSRARERDAVIKVLVPARGRAHRDFLIGDLDKILDIFTDEEAALRSFGP